MAPRPDLLHPRAPVILGWIPPFLRTEPDNIAFAHCLARESERAEGFIEWVRDQLNPVRAGAAGLAWYSRLLRLPVAPDGADVEQTRIAVIGRIRALAGDPSERDWVARVTARLGTDAWTYLTQDSVLVGAPPAQTIRVTVPWEAGSDADVAARQAIREETPSELAIVYETGEGFLWDVSQWDVEAWGN